MHTPSGYPRIFLGGGWMGFSLPADRVGGNFLFARHKGGELVAANGGGYGMGILVTVDLLWPGLGGGGGMPVLYDGMWG